MAQVLVQVWDSAGHNQKVRIIIPIGYWEEPLVVEGSMPFEYAEEFGDEDIDALVIEVAVEKGSATFRARLKVDGKTMADQTGWLAPGAIFLNASKNGA